MTATEEALSAKPCEAMKTQVGIIGAGPAGMFLAHLLHQAGIDSVVLERRDRAYVEGRVRAGVLEQTTVDIMRRIGLDARLTREGLPHDGFSISFDDELFRIDLAGLTDGKRVTVYGQQEVMKDLYDAAEARGLSIVFDAEDVRPHDIASDMPSISWTSKGEARRLTCDFIVGCDGYHGVSRAAMPADVRQEYEKIYPFGWLGILADVPPADHELIYASHARGFALASMRSKTRSRYYIQCGAEEKLKDWPDERIWDELALRLGAKGARGITRGPSFEKTIAPLRSHVAEPMRHGRLFLAGDAAHIVPPTGAKGLNLASSDVLFLSEALADFYKSRSTAGIDDYSRRALARVWKAERFSWWFTGVTHRFPNTTALERRLQVAEIDYIRSSRAAQTTLAENYVGLPLR
jgi:p-hydroxybenzoate 3-monooxygenase